MASAALLMRALLILQPRNCAWAVRPVGDHRFFFFRMHETSACLKLLPWFWEGTDARRKERHMGILDDLLAGGQLQKQFKDFIERYEQGDPAEGYSHQEVLKRYGEVSHAVPPDQYAQAAQEALSKLSPEE